MVDVRRAAEQIAKLTLMKFFPVDPQARTALVQLICGMAQTNEQVEWLVRRALTLFNEWPGPRELRALYCSKFRPADGAEANSALYPSHEYGGGFPSELPRQMPALTPGRDEARKMLAGIAEGTKHAE